MFEHIKTLGISHALHMLLRQGPFLHSRPYYLMRNFISWKWKILPFGKYFCFYSTW